MMHYFKWAYIVTILGLALGALLGWQTTGTVGGMLSVFFICCVLAVLEISLSFDNAIVNANKLKDMTPEWQHRFLTWGIVIAVFGMRIVFPLLIVVVAANIGPWQAMVLAATQPDEYSRIMHDAHLPIAAFGGTFLMMVGLSFFFDHEKDVHWVRLLERRMQKYATIRGIEVALVLVTVLIFSSFLDPAESQVFFSSAIWGLLTFLLVEVLGGLLDSTQETLKAGAKGYLLKDVSLEQLVGAIRTVADGGSLVQPAVTQRLLSGLEHMRNEFVSLDRPDPLTDRETEILRLMASGFSNKEIANSLGVAEGTIKNHVSNILSKLGVRDRTRAVLKAFELQLV